MPLTEKSQASRPRSRVSLPPDTQTHPWSKTAILPVDNVEVLVF